MKTPFPRLIPFLMIAFYLFAAALVSFAGEYQPGNANEGGFTAPEETPEALLERIERNFYGKETDKALLGLARAYSRKKEIKDAARTYQRIIEGFPEGAASSSAFTELAYLRYKSGLINEARALLDGLSSRRQTTDEAREKAKALSVEIDSILTASSERPSSIAIGALLPMKGVYAPFGEEAARGILLAADVFGSGGQRAEVYVKDVSTDAAAAGLSIEELSGNVRVAGIIGPLLSPAAREAALYAQKLGVPLITLSQKEGAASAGGYVFRNSLTHADQAGAIAAYAYKGLGSRKFAILYPQNNYGTELKEFFKEEARRQGGEVVKELGYVPGTKDFSRELTSLFGITGKERREGRRTIKEFTPTVLADALYIPDYYETVSMIVPYLEYYDIKGVRLLGSNGWNSPRLAALSGKGVEGAVFVDGFFANSQRRGSAEFAERFRAAYGTDPGVLEAQAYDAARVLITAAVGGTGREGRDGVKDGLRAVKDYIGAAGALSFNEKGAAIKRLFILTVRDGAITEILEE